MIDILIVEDEPFFARVCGKTLAKPGRNVRIARDGREAMREMRKRPPDLLLLDLLLPVIDGFSLLTYIREQRHDYPAIILSNLGEQGEPEIREHFSAAAYLVKSETSLQELEEKVDGCLAPLAIQ